jgi:hypothetical protein
MKAAMLREWQTVNQAGLSPHDVHCHQYLAISRYLTDPPFSGLSLFRNRHSSRWLLFGFLQEVDDERWKMLLRPREVQVS